MDTVKFRIIGLTPLLAHNGRLADPLDAYPKHLKVLTAKRSKTDADYAAIKRCEWEGAIYFNESGPFIPCYNLDACIKGGAKAQKLGKKFGSSVAVVEDWVPIEFDGPRNLDALWDARYYDIRGVVIGGKRLQRCRPMFKDWAATFTVAYDSRDVDRPQIVKAVEDAGRLVGLFDFRPEKGGRMGKFVPEVVA